MPLINILRVKAKGCQDKVKICILLKENLCANKRRMWCGCINRRGNRLCHCLKKLTDEN